MRVNIAVVCVGAVAATTGCTLLDESPTVHVVEIVSDLDAMSMYFEPRDLRIEKGDTVTWVNRADIDHNMITYPDGFPKGAVPFESPYLSVAGDSWSHTFTVEGTYEYHCVPHLVLGMEGTVVVGQASAEQDFHEPSANELTYYRGLLLEYFDGDEAEFRPRSKRSKRSQ